MVSSVPARLPVLVQRTAASCERAIGAVRVRQVHLDGEVSPQPPQPPAVVEHIRCVCLAVGVTATSGSWPLGNHTIGEAANAVGLFEWSHYAPV